MTDDQLKEIERLHGIIPEFPLPDIDPYLCVHPEIADKENGEYWNEIKSMDFEKAIGVMMERKFWANTLERMLPDDADYREFWDDFWTINAHNSRSSAVAGTTNKGHAFEQALYNAAILAGKKPMEALIDPTAKDPDFNRPDGFMSYEQIGMAFVTAVSENDPRIFTRLANVIQNGGTLPANKGGEDSMLGQD